jgi:hypothetical protein
MLLSTLIKQVYEDLPTQAMAELSTFEEHELIQTHHGWGSFLRNSYQMWTMKIYDDNGQLMHPDDASREIIKAVWKRLKGIKE